MLVRYIYMILKVLGNKKYWNFKTIEKCKVVYNIYNTNINLFIELQHNDQIKGGWFLIIVLYFLYQVKSVWSENEQQHKKY